MLHHSEFEKTVSLDAAEEKLGYNLRKTEERGERSATGGFKLLQVETPATVSRRLSLPSSYGCDVVSEQCLVLLKQFSP